MVLVIPFRCPLDNREEEKDTFCRARSAGRYEGIADTFVQLFPFGSNGLIALVQGAGRNEAIWQRTRQQLLRERSKELARDWLMAF